MNSLESAIRMGDLGAVTAALRQDLLRNIENIPSALKEREIWLLWKVGKVSPKRQKFSKLPFSPVTLRQRKGKQGSKEDRASLGTFAAALKAIQSDDSYAGLGIATLPGAEIVALDADRCVHYEDGQPVITDAARNACADTYTELSPSGTGLRAFWFGETENCKNHLAGFELFSTTGFVTITGNRLCGREIRQLSPDHHDYLVSLAGKSAAENGRKSARSAGLSKSLLARQTEQLAATPERLADLEQALKFIPADDYNLWIDLGLALKTLGDAAKPIWHSWSATCSDYEEAEAEEKWQSFDPVDTGYRAIFAKAKKHGWSGGNANAAASALPADPVEIDLKNLPQRPPRIPFLIPLWLPQNTVTLFAAHGGTGKSFLSVRIALCVATGWHPFKSGERLPARRVLLYSAEDDSAVLQGRILRYLHALNIPATGLLGRLMVLDATASDNALYRADRDGGTTTRRYDWLARKVRDFGAELLIFDNASDAMDANENDRSAVRQLMSALRTAAPTVLLLSHLDAASTMARRGAGKGYSGSTAWHNSARSRWLLERHDECVTLTLEKSNYGPLGAVVTFGWDDERRVFDVVRCADAPPDAKTVERTLFTLLATVLGNGKRISPHQNARNNVYKSLCDQKGFPLGIQRHHVRDLVDGWIAKGLVEEGSYTGSNRRDVACLLLTERGHAFAKTLAEEETVAPMPYSGAPA